MSDSLGQIADGPARWTISTRSSPPRLAEFAFEPGFVAAVDQHAAEIRERLNAQGPELQPRPLTRADLVDYALGFCRWRPRCRTRN